MKLCAISVDLDEVHHYFAIHGLSPTAATQEHAVYDIAVERLLAFGRSHGIPLTFFAVGADLARPANAARLRDAARGGTEIANHSYSHKYDFSRLSKEEIKQEVLQGADAIEAATGVRPKGFRAPGYTINDTVFEVLAESGVAYDSSVFPCPAYYAAKTAAIGAIRAAGRTSKSIVDDPRVLLAPTRPYQVGSPYWSRGGGLRELPIQVTPGPRLPVIGTNVVASGPVLASGFARAVAGESFVNLELHGIDLLDASDGLEALRPHQFDVRVPRARKEASLNAFVKTLHGRGFQFVTLADAADQVFA